MGPLFLSITTKTTEAVASRKILGLNLFRKYTGSGPTTPLRPYRQRAYLALPISLCVACSSQVSSPTTATPTSTPKAAAGEGRLVFLSAVDANREIGKTTTIQDPASGAALSSPSMAVLASLDSQNDVGSACRLPPAPVKGGERNRLAFLAAPLAALAGWGIEQVVTWVSDKISSELQAQVAKYTRSYEINSKTFDFYQSFTGNTYFDSAQPYRSCIRLTSLASIPDDKSADPVLSDLLIAITHEPGQTSSVSIRPVRLLVSRIQVPTSDKQVAIAYSLAATSRARGINSVSSPETDFSAPVLAAKLDSDSLKSQYFYKVYTGSEPGASAHDYSIPSWDLMAIGRPPKDDEMTLSMTVTEVGDVPWLLKQINNLVQDNKENVTKYAITNLQNAATAAINPTATPKKTSP